MAEIVLAALLVLLDPQLVGLLGRLRVDGELYEGLYLLVVALLVRLDEVVDVEALVRNVDLEFII